MKNPLVRNFQNLAGMQQLSGKLKEVRLFSIRTEDAQRCVDVQNLMNFVKSTWSIEQYGEYKIKKDDRMLEWMKSKLIFENRRGKLSVLYGFQVNRRRQWKITGHKR